MDRKQFLSKLALGTSFLVILAILMRAETTLPWIWSKVMTVVAPIAGGVVIAFLLSIPSRAIDRVISSRLPKSVARLSKGISLLLAIILILVFLTIIFSLVLPEFIHACTILVESLRDFASDEEFWSRIDLSALPFISEAFGDIDESITTLAELLESKIRIFSEPILSFTIQSMLSIISWVISFFIMVVFSCYFIMNRDMLKTHIHKVMSLMMKTERIKALTHVINVASTAFSRFITAQITEALIIGVLCFAGMVVLRLPNGAAISAFTGLMALIPIYGAIIGAVVGAFIIAMTSPWQGLFFLIFIFVLQQLEGDFIYPRVVGSSTGIPSVYVFTAVTIGGALFGLAGMLFAVPVFSTVYTILRERLSEDKASTGPKYDTEAEGRLEE